MTAEVIDGKAAAAEVLDKVRAATERLVTDTGVQPGIAVIIVGEDPASQYYVRSKGRRAEECGFKSETYRLPANTPEADLLALIDRLNANDSIHGILVQLPAPDHIDEGKIIQAVAPHKDVDGFSFINVGKLTTGQIGDAFIPCTPAGCMVLLRRTLGTADFSGQNAVVIGRSNLVGKPMLNLLLGANATVTIAHSRTRDLAALCRTADILVAAVGRPEMVGKDWIKPGATIIDVGINRVPAPEKGEDGTRIVGDVAYEECAEIAGAITPVPGGVGQMTVAMLMASTLASACRVAGVKPPSY